MQNVNQNNNGNNVQVQFNNNNQKKTKEIKKVADEYKQVIPDKVYKALLEW